MHGRAAASRLWARVATTQTALLVSSSNSSGSGSVARAPPRAFSIWPPIGSANHGAMAMHPGTLRTQARCQSSPSPPTPPSGGQALTVDDIDELLNQLGDGGDDKVGAHMEEEEEGRAGEGEERGRAGGAARTKASTPPRKRKPKKGDGELGRKKTKKAKVARRRAQDESTAATPPSAFPSTEPRATIAAARNLLVGDDQETAKPAAVPGGSLPKERRGDTHRTGWSYESVDPRTGKTPLEVLYESNLDRIQRILEQPLPPLPQDGHVNPHFFVGFGHYDYRLRDEYRAVLARELRVPVRCVKLSVAWGGRFDVSKFNRVRKVCGVCLDSSTIPDAQNAANTSTGRRSSTEHDLPKELQQRVASLVADINARRSEHLLQSQFLQASEAIPEVEFAYTHREHRLLVRVNEWLHANLLKPTLAVIVVGGNQALRGCHPELLRSGRDNGKESAAEEETRRHVTDSPAFYKCLARHASETRKQNDFVTDVWLKPFHNRHVIPRRVSLGESAALVAGAVLRGEIAHVSATMNVAASTEEESLLPKNVQHLLRECASELRSSSTTAGGQEDGNAGQRECIFDSDKYWAAQSPDMQAAAVQWLHITREALFLGAQQQQQQQQQQHRIGAVHGGSDSQTQKGEGEADATTADDDSGAYRRLTQFTGDMPALFVHGAYAGGLREMRYLRSNKAAMDALLLHPNDVTMKRSFASRMRNGHQRLRMHEELAASEHQS